MKLLLTLLLFAGTAIHLVANEKLPPAFTQQRKADAVVEFLRWDSLTLSKPEVEATLRFEDLDDQLKRNNIDRNFIVIVCSKRAAPGSEDMTPGNIAKRFQGLGFKRVVVQQAIGGFHPDGLPILFDSDKLKNKTK